MFFQEIAEGIFNLAFGDWVELDQKIDDNIRSNNSDKGKVLATVASTVIDFINYHPKAVILAHGSTLSRTRLYQMGVLANWNEIDHLFNIQGFSNGIWEPFKEGKNYEEFALEAK